MVEERVQRGGDADSGRNITVAVYRFDPDHDDRPHDDRYQVPWRPGMTLLDALFHILEHQDGSLAFRYSCREAICGSCAMYANGRYVLACKTQLESLRSDVVAVGPLPHLRVLKDLVVDMEPFWRNYKAVVPYLVGPEDQQPEGAGGKQEREYLQSPRDRSRLDEPIDCVLCAACYSSCPTTWQGDRDYLGPAALQKAARFALDSRDTRRGERVDLVSTENGLWRCHTAFNCVAACPKGIPIVHGIQAMKRASVGRRFGVGRR